MKLISHRGNINGPKIELENQPEYIDSAILNGFDVEIDVWYEKNIFWLGHDEPKYKVDFEWFVKRISKLWIHCKNINAVIFFNSNSTKFNYFWHQNDDVTLTSLNFIWAYPGKQPTKKSIAVLPEKNNDDLSHCSGICSDYINKYKNTI
jgi:hypothetical protein